MILSIIVIGDEILIGQVTDTNSGFISRSLGGYGWETRRVVTVGDNAGDISRAIAKCMSDSDLVITTGGLGPTKDDITKGVMLDIFGGELRHDESIAENIRRVFDLRGLRMNPLTAAQAEVPTSCKVIQNKLGTAPIMWFERDGKVLVAMPGVPFETEGMMKESVMAEIKAHFDADTAIGHRVMMISGITESSLATMLEEFEASLPEGMHLAYLPTPGLIRLRLDYQGKDSGQVEAELDAQAKKLREATGDYLLYEGDATAAEIAIHFLREAGYRLATAESCTGGNIAHSITAIAGCSDVYAGGVVSYANEVKINVLGVNEADIAEHGAVSQATVMQMAEGAARICGTECSVATSGIAGPGGGSEDKPVGTVWTAVHTPKGTKAFVRYYPGNRGRVIDRATTEALLALVHELK